MGKETEGSVPHIHSERTGTVLGPPRDTVPHDTSSPTSPSPAQHPHSSAPAGSAPAFISNPAPQKSAGADKAGARTGPSPHQGLQWVSVP